VTTAREKTKPPNPRRLVGESALPHPKCSTDQPTQHGGRLVHLVSNEPFWCDPSVPSDVKCVLGAYAAHPKRRPTRKEILTVLPFLTNNRFAAAINYITSHHLAFADRDPCKGGNPMRLTGLAPHVDTRRGEHLIYTPTAPVARFSRRTGATDTILLGFYHSLQHARHGIQSPDRTTAAILGWRHHNKVRASRLRLIEVEALVAISPARGREGAAVYAIPEALLGSEAVFDHCDHPGCPKCFHEEWTPSLRRISLRTDTLTVLASEAKVFEFEARIENATKDTLARLDALARAQTEPHPFITASDLDALLDDASSSPKVDRKAEHDEAISDRQGFEERWRKGELTDDDIPF
jgi:hypothetical protein